MPGELTPLLEVEAGQPPESSQQQAAGGQQCSESSSTLTIEHLPDDVMLEIFSYVSTIEIINTVQNVCTYWRELTQNACLWYHRECVVRDAISEKEARKVFAAMPQLRVLKLQCFVMPYIFEAVSESCHKLVTLEVLQMEAISYSLAKKLFDGCNDIRILKISKTVLEDNERFADAVAQLPHLEVLQLLEEPRCFGPTRVHMELRPLADSCPHLRELQLGSVPYRIQDAEYFISAKKRTLKKLGLKWTAIEGRCIVPLLTVCADTLESLSLIECNVHEEEDEEVFTTLQQFQSLHTLSLCFLYRGLRPEFMVAFRNDGFPKLRDLTLKNFTQDGREILLTISESCPELRTLTLENCVETVGTFLYAVKQFNKLQSLCKFEKLETLKLISYTPVKINEGLRYIAKIPALHSLYIKNITFLDQMYYIDIARLQYLSLHNVTCDKMLFNRFPARLVNLRELIFNGCFGDQRKVDQMRALMPDLDIKGKLEYRPPEKVSKRVLYWTRDDDDSLDEFCPTDNEWSD